MAHGYRRRPSPGGCFCIKPADQAGTRKTHGTIDDGGRRPTVDSVRIEAFGGLQKLMLPDRWQAEAIQALNAGQDVIIDAPTGAGKTYVFERWAEQMSFARRALFTVPTRALANDKYAEWRARGWRTGIMTGDVTIAPDSPVVVATLEAVQGLAGGAVAAAAPRTNGARPASIAFQLLVVDEYQWLADSERGNHYEGVLLSLSPAMQLLLLSGTVANPGDIAAWLRRLNRNVEVIQHRERPVPLEEVDVDDLIHGLPAGIEGFWSRRVAGALREGLGPVLVFAPHRQDAERLARQFAREISLTDPLVLTTEQEQLLGPALTKLIKQRVAYHHSGLTYAQRAGVIEPLAKAGQLRAVVATLGLSAGINFSLRSVLITATSYRFDQLEHEIEPHELLQMIGRAGRRGLDDTGYVLAGAHTPSLRRCLGPSFCASSATATARSKSPAPPPADSLPINPSCSGPRRRPGASWKNCPAASAPTPAARGSCDGRRIQARFVPTAACARSASSSARNLRYFGSGKNSDCLTANCGSRCAGRSSRFF